MTQKHLQSNKIFSIAVKRPEDRRRRMNLIVRPVNGEDCFNEVGLSHGFVHFADPVTGERLGFCGVSRFDKHATEVDAK